MRELNEQNFNKFFKWVAEDFKLLARLHAVELDHETFEYIVKSEFPYCLTFDPQGEKPIFPVLKKAIEEVQKNGVSFDILAADFAAIYLNVTYEASPNESAWIDEDHLERQEPMFEIRNWYKKYNLQTVDWRVRQDDNLSQQLLFISHLLNLEKVPIRDINHFMDYHILRWIENFGEKIFQRAETAFYSSLALLTSQYLIELRNILAEIEEKPRPTKEQVDDACRKNKTEFVYDPVYYSSHGGGW